ncbi:MULTISPECIES: thiamine pyrophosphate-binding protein [unclassified Achromobacter]|uniref:thiamine pyrophosphate-binding protein n=1 Tax=unclassified Achromobacter TaxID=2626865 RepID=UPI000B5163FE|nr:MULTISPECIES: thiamine pyrophosphate-binding protein [unclassified Achromobacter]OWT68944.1 acetolactate synthase [Achromobacter sp. HZ28]OWT78493.1 acetolactate synthase [Achromobacter sp. HZ34]
MSVPRNGAAALASTLAAAGVKRLFTLSGNHIMPVFDACLDAGIELLHTRHEAAAVHMADAWARLTGEPGVALVTGGPGHANAVSALYTASMAESPVVLLSGHAPHAQLGMGAFQEMRQTDIAAPLTKAATLAASADSMAQDLLQALRLAQSGRPGPVHLSLPTDALESACTQPLPAQADIAPIAQPLSAESAQACLQALAQARRPLILTGPAAMRGVDQDAATALEQACGIPVIGMQSPRGVADPALGAYAEMLAQADCILLLGKRLDFTLKFGKAPALAADCTFLQIDADSIEFERSQRAVGTRLALTAQADHRSALAALRDACAGYTPRHPAWTAEVRAAVAYRPAAWATATAQQHGRLHPYQALAPVQAVLDRHPDAVLVADGGEIGQWAQAILHAPDRVLNGVAGSIGAALPFAVAASLARPGAPIVAVMGDGTFGFHAAEIDTAVRYRLPFVVVVGNDARWNAEYQIQVRDYGPERTVGCELLPTRYDLVTQAFGGHGSLVTMSEAVTPALAQARGCGLPACVNIMIEGLPAPVVQR